MGASTTTRRRFFEKSFADASRTPPRVRAVEPSLVHVAGGASVVVSGAGFDGREVECLFAHQRAGAGKIARATTSGSNANAARIACETPSFVEHGVELGEYAQVFARNGASGAWSGTIGNFQYQSETRARNTFATLRLDGSAPGCYGCFASSVAVGSRARETWTVVSDGGASAGPMDGGTTVRVAAKNLADGSPGTFYPGNKFACGVFCASASGGGWKFASGTARWLAYDLAECETPPWPGSGADATTCLLRFSNDGTTYDDLVATGGDGDGTGAGVMANAAKVDYAYASLVPTVTTISTVGLKTPATSRYSARGRFAGGTEIVVVGTNFLPSSRLACAFVDNAHGTVIVRATYVSSTEIRCVSPSRLDVVDPDVDETDYGTGAPCVVSRLRASNTEVNARVNSWSADGTDDATAFHFCDLYVSTSGGSISRADGSSTRPFARIQDAFDVAHENDVIRIAPGVYAGDGNVRLIPPRSDGVRVAATKDVIIDCEDEHPLFAVGDADRPLGNAATTRCGSSADKASNEFTETCEAFGDGGGTLACRRYDLA